MTQILPLMAVAAPIDTVDDLRVEALQRLYRRRDLVDELIETLERYELAKNSRLAPCVPISVGRGWCS